LLHTLNDVTTENDIVCADASFASNWVAAFVTSKATGQRFLMPRGLAGLGWGFPLAVGAQLARPAGRVFAVVGDGGFAHCWSELETAVRTGVNVIVIVLNNQVLGLQRLGEELLFGTHSDASDLGPVDHAAIAESCGCHGTRVTSPTAFEAALRRAVDAGRPALLDVLVDASARPPVTMFDTGPSKNATV
jgi:acetolactate synthase-1/2/3 large subunit